VDLVAAKAAPLKLTRRHFLEKLPLLVRLALFSRDAAHDLVLLHLGGRLLHIVLLIQT